MLRTNRIQLFPSTPSLPSNTHNWTHDEIVTTEEISTAFDSPDMTIGSLSPQPRGENLRERYPPIKDNVSSFFALTHDASLAMPISHFDSDTENSKSSTPSFKTALSRASSARSSLRSSLEQVRIAMGGAKSSQELIDGAVRVLRELDVGTGSGSGDGVAVSKEENEGCKLKRRSFGARLTRPDVNLLQRNQPDPLHGLVSDANAVFERLAAEEQDVGVGRNVVFNHVDAVTTMMEESEVGKGKSKDNSKDELTNSNSNEPCIASHSKPAQQERPELACHRRMAMNPVSNLAHPRDAANEIHLDGVEGQWDDHNAKDEAIFAVCEASSNTAPSIVESSSTSSGSSSKPKRPTLTRNNIPSNLQVSPRIAFQTSTATPIPSSQQNSNPPPLQFTGPNLTIRNTPSVNRLFFSPTARITAPAFPAPRIISNPMFRYLATAPRTSSPLKEMKLPSPTPSRELELGNMFQATVESEEEAGAREMSEDECTRLILAARENSNNEDRRSVSTASSTRTSDGQEIQTVGARQHVSVITVNTEGMSAVFENADNDTDNENTVLFSRSERSKGKQRETSNSDTSTERTGCLSALKRSIKWKRGMREKKIIREGENRFERKKALEMRKEKMSNDKLNGEGRWFWGLFERRE